MRFDLSKPICNRAGQPIKLAAGDGPGATLTDAIVHVLDGYVDPPQQAGQHSAEAQRRFVLGTKISAASGIIDLTQDDITFVKKHVGNSLMLPLVIGQIFEAFENPLPKVVAVDDRPDAAA